MGARYISTMAAEILSRPESWCDAKRFSRQLLKLFFNCAKCGRFLPMGGNMTNCHPIHSTQPPIRSGWRKRSFLKVYCIYSVEYYHCLLVSQFLGGYISTIPSYANFKYEGD
jgi:hypothetical protein